MQISDAQNRLGRVREELHAIRNHPVREPFDNVIFRAQVHSKLYWLKLQGKHVEYQEYEKRVAEATKQRLKKGHESGRRDDTTKKKAGKEILPEEG